MNAKAFYLRKMKLVPIYHSAMRDLTPLVVKHLMHYMQITKRIVYNNFLLPSFLNFLPDLVSIPIEKLNHFLDCILIEISGIEIVYLRAMWSLIIPFIYAFSVLVIYILGILITPMKHNTIYMYTGAAFLLIYLQPGEVQAMLSLISCNQVLGKYYIKADPNYECYT